MDTENNINKKNKEKSDDFDSDDELSNNNNNFTYEKNANTNSYIEKDLEECYLDILEKNRESGSIILDKCNIVNFEKFIKKHS